MKNKRFLIFSLLLAGSLVVAMGVMGMFSLRLVSAGTQNASYIDDIIQRLHRLETPVDNPQVELKKIEMVLKRLKESVTAIELSSIERRLSGLKAIEQSREEYIKLLSSVEEELESVRALLHREQAERLKRLKQYWIALLVFSCIPFGVALFLTTQNRRQPPDATNQMDTCTENLPVPVIKIDEQGCIVKTNYEFVQWSGYDEKECRGRRLDSLVDRSECYRITDLLEGLLKGKTIRGVHVRFVKKGGGSHVELDGAPIRDGTGRALVVLKDMESIKKVMTELEGARKRAEEAKEKLKKMVNELEEFALIAIRREMKLKEIKERILTEDKKH